MLVGKFFFHMGSEYVQTGEIVEEPHKGLVLVRFDHDASCCNAPPSLELFPIDLFFTELDDEGSVTNEWQFFNSRQELKNYEAWLGSPVETKQSGKVTKLRTVN